MVKRRKQKRPHPHPKVTSAIPPVTVEYMLERGTLEELRAAKARTEALLKYHWEYYAELARQRNEIQGDLQKALIQSCATNYKFEKWQRAVKWKYGLHPLSTAGSINGIGQRFNTGGGVNSEVPSFPALYIAEDKNTALQETLGQIEIKGSKLSAQERALTNPQSEVIVSVSGELEELIDLTTTKSLESFFALVKEFKLSEALHKQAKAQGSPEPDIVRTVDLLMDTLLHDDWRISSFQWDVPANSQIFGHLIYQAGIEGILYPSKFTGKKCLAIFPHNFAMSSSFVAFDDESPHVKIPKRIDGTNWRVCDLLPKELIDGVEMK